MRQEVLIGVERRRRWSIEQKLEVLSEVGVDGATVAEVARRYDITRQHIYQWRREFRRRHAASREETKFLPVEVAEPRLATTASEPSPQDRTIEIGLRNGRTVRAAADMAEDLLMRAIRIAETA